MQRLTRLTMIVVWSATAALGVTPARGGEPAQGVRAANQLVLPHRCKNPLPLVAGVSVGKTSSRESVMQGTLEELKVAAVQMSGYDKTDLPRAGYAPSEAVVRYVRRAAEDGAQLVVFPEYVLGRIPVPSPATRSISTAAAAGRIYVVVGCWEILPDGSFANAALLFDRGGRIAGKYYKTHAAVDHYQGEPPWSRPPEGKDTDWFIKNDPEWIMERGDDLPVFELDFGKVGILTCYDGWFPESFRVLSLKGAEIIVWINGRRGSVEDFILKSAVFRNHVAMICTNQAYGGGTMIGDWPARILARCADKREGYIAATINLAGVRRARQFSRNFRQRRPELYGEIVKPLPAPPEGKPAPIEPRE